MQELNLEQNHLSGGMRVSLTELPRLESLSVAMNEFDYESSSRSTLRACSTVFGIDCTGGFHTSHALLDRAVPGPLFTFVSAR